MGYLEQLLAPDLRLHNIGLEGVNDFDSDENRPLVILHRLPDSVNLPS